MKPYLKIVILFLISSIAFAANDNFLANTAMSYFTKADWAIFNSTQNKALNNASNGAKVSWKNPATGAYGYMIPSAAPRVRGLSCRKLFL